MKIKADTALGTIYSVLSAVLFGFTPLIAKTAYGFGYTTYMVAFSRFLIGSILLFIIIKTQNKHKILLPKKQLIRILIITVFYAMMIILMYSAYRYIDSGLTTTLHFSYPVFVIIIAAVFSHNKLSKREFVATLFAIIGIVLLNNSSVNLNYFGAVLALLSGLSYAVYIYLTEKLELADIPPFVLAFWISVFSVVVVGAALIFTPKQPVNWSVSGIGILVLLALTTNVFAIVLFQKGLSLCGGVKASLFSTFEPLTSVVVGLIVFKEALSVDTVIGILLILSSTVVLVLKGNSD